MEEQPKIGLDNPKGETTNTGRKGKEKRRCSSDDDDNSNPSKELKRPKIHSSPEPRRLTRSTVTRQILSIAEVLDLPVPKRIDWTLGLAEHLKNKTYSNSRKTVESVVIKNLRYYHKFDPGNYKFWAEGQFGKKPLEVEVLQRLQQTDNHSSFLTITAFSMDEKADQVYIYSPYGKFGDLKGALQKSGIVPEPYIWYAASNLVSAIETMATGSSSLDKPEDWIPILHLDITPANILLVKPEDNIGMKYNWPGLELIDFGSAAELRPPTEERHRNPLDFLNRDICSMGQVLFCLMSAEQKGEPQWAYTKKQHLHQNGEEDNVDDISFNDKYSTELKNLVKKALSFRPEDRDLPAVMLNDIKLEWVSQEDVAGGLKDKVFWEEKDDCKGIFKYGEGKSISGKYEVGKQVPKERHERIEQDAEGAEDDEDDGDDEGAGDAEGYF
ncbi:hypothetical protein EJ08DRAFT_662925 [Tothia fuscella]|uniref:Protein kinase domain-containing protein n=1 Tax=Tothia fuscella TaxID=1048955 RepID=A0A9P4NLN8_9PEZI|nr:hypothetical protein EJ08DRAFT_662925 [Tothia fuscella]